MLTYGHKMMYMEKRISNMPSKGLSKGLECCQDMLQALLIESEKDQLSSEIDVSVSSLNRLLRGSITEPSHEVFARITYCYFAKCYDTHGKPL